MSFMKSGLMMGVAYPVLTVGLSTTGVSGSSTGSSVTSGSVSALPAGGSGFFSYQWTLVSGSGPTPNTPTGPTTSFSGSIGSAGSSLSATYRCVVKDLVTGLTVPTSNVSVYLERTNPPLSGSASNASQTGTSSGTINVTAGSTASGSGGVPPYSYTWSGGAGFTVSPSDNVCYFGVALGPGQSRSGSATVRIRDSIGQYYDVSISISCTNNGTPAPSLSASASPSTVNGASPYATVTTASTTITPSGGVAPYSYSWARVSGNGSASGGQTCTFTHTFSGYPLQSTGGTFVCTVTDAVNNTTQVTVSAGWTWFDSGIA